MKKHRLILLFFIGTLLLQACGTSVLVKHEATNTVTAGKNAICEVNKFHNSIFETQNQLAASLLARYPSCNFGNSIVIRTNFASAGRLKTEQGLCLSDAELKKWQSADPKEKSFLGRKIDLMPMERSSLKSSMDILDGFAVYLDAISKHVASPTTPIANTLKGVADELVVLQGKVKFMSDTVSSKASQSIALSDFIGYLEKLIKNRNDAGEIAKIVETEGEKQERNLSAVATEVDDIYTTYIASMNATFTTILGNYYNKNKSSKEFDSVEKRERFLLALFKQQQLDMQIHMSSSPGAKAIRLFVSAHRKLRDSITGKYSEEQKAFIQEENINELKEGLLEVSNVAQFVR
jgi:hypothetical protein